MIPESKPCQVVRPRGRGPVNPHDLAPLWLSLRVASLATVAIVAPGLPLALLLARGRFPGKGLLAGVLVLPLVLPPTVLGYYLLQVLGRRGWLGLWLERTWGVTLVFHWSGAVVASAVAAFPLFLLPARAAIEGVDPALEDAARLLGRRELSVFVSVTLPLAWRGLAAGAMLAFAPRPGRLRRDADGRRQHPGRDPDRRAGHLRRRPGQRRDPCRVAHPLDLAPRDRDARRSSSGPCRRRGLDVERGRDPRRPSRAAGPPGADARRRAAARARVRRRLRSLGRGQDDPAPPDRRPGDARPRSGPARRRRSCSTTGRGSTCRSAPGRSG